MPSEVGYILTRAEQEAILKALEEATLLISKGRIHQHEWQYVNDSGGNRQTCRSCGETMFIGFNCNA